MNVVYVTSQHAPIVHFVNRTCTFIDSFQRQTKLVSKDESKDIYFFAGPSPSSEDLLLRLRWPRADDGFSSVLVLYEGIG
jgi:hypothetical protein